MEKAAETAARGKKRKSRLQYDSDDLQESSVQLKTRRLADVTPVNLPSSTCNSAGSYGALGSCCSTNGSSHLDKEEEVEVTVDQFLMTSNGVTLDRGERSDMESTARPSASKPRRSCFTGKKMPSDDEIEQFFSSSEKNLQKQFIDKYNYDVVKDEPLEGRFEWFQIRQKFIHDGEES